MDQPQLLDHADAKNYILDILRKNVIYSTRITNNKGVKYYNIPCGFDIETSSFYSSHEEKQALMYEWTLGINEDIIFGRTWEDFLEVLDFISETLRLSKDNILVIYIHNLSFEFQFMRKLFDWLKVFSIDSRKPIYAISANGFEFRCSYLLSGYSLSKLAEQLTKHKVSKLVGDLDYKLVRTPITPLTNKEWQYCYNDVQIILCYIKEQIEFCGDITQIPITKTGFVRNYCRKSCLPKKDKKSFYRYRDLMKCLTLDSEEYQQLKRAFQGGFTHANAFEVGKILTDIGSFDFTSSYPYVMVSEKFPMSKSVKIVISSHEEFIYNLKNYCCLFDIEIFDLTPKLHQESPLSKSRCSNIIDAVINNGRIVSAKHLTTTITELDYSIIYNFYEWSKIKIYNFRRYEKSYLPTPFIKAILKLYADKTTLKGVEGKEVEYLKSKENINATYGMTVTDICRELITYFDDEWGVNKPNIDEAIEKHNKSIKRFLFYPWGVWVTAYARRNLFTGIKEFGSDYVYSDTDSIKGKNISSHEEYIKRYNSECIRKLNNAMDFHKLPYESYKPKTIKGEEKILGIWDYEGTYKRFKTLGAKRYMVEKDDKINLTVSGVNKSKAIPYLINKYGNDIFKKFEDGLEIPKEYTGKNIHAYIDDEMYGNVTDYLGQTYNYHELSGVHLEETSYNLSISAMFGEYLMKVNKR